MQSRPDVSVIVPLGPAEQDAAPILTELGRLPAEWQRILVLCPQSRALLHTAAVAEALERQQVQVIEAPLGRAVQQNAGARVARGNYLWFLHADSRLPDHAAAALQQSLTRNPEALGYFRLAFAGDGPGGMGLNAWGANLRSRFGIPFGDQGFCLARACFFELGGFDEQAAYGEDHLLVWRAHQQRVPLVEVAATLTTSARRYRERGWWHLTLAYQRLWLKQAWPEFWRLLKLRLYGRV